MCIVHVNIQRVVYLVIHSYVLEDNVPCAHGYMAIVHVVTLPYAREFITTCSDINMNMGLHNYRTM
jgi:hypothetical protein